MMLISCGDFYTVEKIKMYIMSSKRKTTPLLISIFILLHLVSPLHSINSICESHSSFMYCSCNGRSRENQVACFLTNENITIDDDVWRSLGSIENAVTLKLISVLPNRLKYIPKPSLEGLTTLRTFTLEEANLGLLKTKSVHGLKSLQELEMNGCDVSGLEPHAISDLPLLKKLFLNENLLQEVLANSLTHLPELEWLYLERNNITRVEPYAFGELHNLKELSLSGNQITDLTDYMFRGLRYLVRLDLYKNRIRILNDKVFHHMPRLIEIYLRDNLITHISPYAFEGLEKLQRLWLNNNKIKMLPDRVFKPLVHLRSLYLTQNELETLQGEVLNNIALFNDQHFSVAFKDNPLVCDCRLSWIKEYLQYNRSHLFVWEVKDVKCRQESTGENITVHLLEMDCAKKTTPTISRSVTQSVSFVPYEINSRSPDNDNGDHIPPDDVPLPPDFLDEDEYLNQDGDESGENLELAEPVPTSSGAGVTVSGSWTLCLVMGTLFLVRRRKGTMLL